MRTVYFSQKYKKDAKLVARRGLDMEKLITVLLHIQKHGNAPDITKPHPLKNNWKGY